MISLRQSYDRLNILLKQEKQEIYTEFQWTLLGKQKRWKFKNKMDNGNN
jgi:hypothetical protein